MADKTITDVFKELEKVNETLKATLEKDDAMLSFQDSQGIVGKIARQLEAKAQKDERKENQEHTRQFDEIADHTFQTADEADDIVMNLERQAPLQETQIELAETVVDQTKPIGTLVSQGEAQIEAAQDAAAIAAEAAREAARAGDEDGPEIAVKLEMEEESGGLFKNMKLGKLIKTFGGWIFSGLSAAFSWLSTSIGPSLLKFVKGFSPWALIITGISLAIKDGITGMFAAEDMGVSKTAGFIGGFLGGGAKGGIANAFANAGKWALVGAGVGALLGAGIFSIPGAIIGGLLGAVLGGILGWIGGEKIAKGADSVGVWFKKQFDDLIIAPIKAIWDVIAPDWIKNIDFEWDDLMPPALTKLFNGEYFTVDFPEFTWMDLFPKFLVDLFNNLKVAGKDTTFEWIDLLPKFFAKFFKGEYSTEGSFQWSDLLPEFINKIIGVATTAWSNTEFTWKSLVPNFILKLIEGTEVKPTGTFSWKDLVPDFVWKLVDGAVAAASTKEGFIWSNLLPDWMIGAWESTKGLAGQVGAFDWRAILPDFISDLFPGDQPLTIAAGLSSIGAFDWRTLLPDFISDLFPGITDKPLTIAAGLAAVGAWDWKSLLPKFIQDFIADPTQLAGDEHKFDWKDLLPQFIRDFFGDKKIDESLTKALDPKWWLGLLPDWIAAIIGGESGDAITGDQKGIGEKISLVFSGIGDRLMKMFTGLIDNLLDLLPSVDDLNPFADDKPSEMTKGERSEEIKELEAKLKAEMAKPKEGSKEDTWLTDARDDEDITEMQQRLAALRKFATGGPVDLTGPAHLTAGEMVLDNNAAQLFVKAAGILSGQNLMDLQRDKTAGGGAAAMMVVNNTNSQQINQSTAMALPASPIIPGNGESTLSGA